MAKKEGKEFLLMAQPPALTQIDFGEFKYYDGAGIDHKGHALIVSFMDEATFGKISEPSYCWCTQGVRPIVPCHRAESMFMSIVQWNPETGEDYYLSNR